MFEETLERLYTIQLREGDFVGEDGLLRCGLCNEPRETFWDENLQSIMGKKHPRMCRCDREEKERDDERKLDEQFRARMEALSLDGLAAPRGLRYKFGDNVGGDAAAFELCHKYCEKWGEMQERGVGILLFGGVGSGKSFLASCVGNAVLSQRVPVLFTNVPRLLKIMFSSKEPQTVVDALQRYPLLILDDFGVERTTDYTLEQLFAIVNARYESRLPLVVTSNLSLEALRNTATTETKRIYDRILSMCQVHVKLTGESRRAAETARAQAELRELFS